MSVDHKVGATATVFGLKRSLGISLSRDPRDFGTRREAFAALHFILVLGLVLRCIKNKLQLGKKDAFWSTRVKAQGLTSSDLK